MDKTPQHVKYMKAMPLILGLVRTQKILYMRPDRKQCIAATKKPYKGLYVLSVISLCDFI